MSAESWKKRVSNVSETIFPGISLHDRIEYRSEIISDLPLQMSLYFNVCFFPVWFITTVFQCLTNLYRFIAVTVQVAVTGIEVLRIYLGYFGNLSEKIPEVAGFWMLSILLQLPLQLFLIVNPQLYLKPIEYTVQSIMLVMLVFQLVNGYHVLRYTARCQASKFHLLSMQARKKPEVNLGFEGDGDHS
ncbi:UNVERIFIED_CONTAM: hypothetical protein PYX00_005783 [Menopon gallinae]|uniref:Transmembrane protein 17 n=1 Tax=Menopon gallinae TaxID=328185 RepID=A0AAW2HTA4_9NEOP